MVMCSSYSVSEALEFEGRKKKPCIYLDESDFSFQNSLFRCLPWTLEMSKCRILG